METPAKIDYKKRIYQAMDHISRNIERDVPLEEASQVACFSSFHFHRIFKAVVGENVAEFTRRIRLELAANRLLSNLGTDVTSIALSCGFSSSQNFSKAFHQRYGLSPSRFRASRSEDDTKLRDASVIGKREMDGRNRMMIGKARIGEMPESTAATVRRIGLSPGACSEAFLELLCWARGRIEPGPGKLLAFYWDNPEITPVDKCRFDCCLALPDDFTVSDPIYTQKIGGGIWAFCRFETDAKSFVKAWEETFRWVVENGYECRSLPCCEIYHNDARLHPGGLWIFDIAVPLKQI